MAAALQQAYRSRDVAAYSRLVRRFYIVAPAAICAANLGPAAPAVGILIALIIAAPWHVLATLRNPPYFDFTMHSEPG